MNYTFYKENTDWFVDLPEWEGSKADLQMVGGADIFLDKIDEIINTNHIGKVTIFITMYEQPSCNVLIKTRDDMEFGGAWYSCAEFDITLWLCDVVNFVFGSLPEKIYYRYPKMTLKQNK